MPKITRPSKTLLDGKRYAPGPTVLKGDLLTFDVNEAFGIRDDDTGYVPRAVEAFERASREEIERNRY